ncbi:MAG: 16S rRNA (guanine(527)-N(7))-methyltransferase RsmG [Limnothrix sp. RL_2_0]|nr:16S rRNA (guanine(527)-N(7))-methyltransferase RsmG [Limnothrix sp. RL_2_0]
MKDLVEKFQSLFQLHQDTLPWQPSPAQLQQLGELYIGICAGNQRLNLTRITTPEDFWEKHLWDSLAAIAPDLNLSITTKLIDVGTGGGFPAFPLAIAFPDWQITLLDSTRKKINFLNELSQQLQFTAHGIAERAEAIGHHPDHRAQYDLVTIRAVGKAAICSEYALPLLKVGGLAILYRGQWTPADTELLAPAIAQCGGTIEAIRTFTTPLTHSQRTCLYLRKTQPTNDQFPRPVGIPKQSPLASV